MRRTLPTDTAYFSSACTLVAGVAASGIVALHYGALEPAGSVALTAAMLGAVTTITLLGAITLIEYESEFQ